MKLPILMWRTLGWSPPFKRSASQTEQLESWSPVCLAWAIDQGLVKHTPLQLTARGWRWVNTNGQRERAIVYGLIGENAYVDNLLADEGGTRGQASDRAVPQRQGREAEGPGLLEDGRQADGEAP